MFPACYSPEIVMPRNSLARFKTDPTSDRQAARNMRHHSNSTSSTHSFDPDELCRRLNLYLAAQREAGKSRHDLPCSEKETQTVPANGNTNDNGRSSRRQSYPTPQVAARDFMRTTSPVYPRERERSGGASGRSAQPGTGTTSSRRGSGFGHPLAVAPSVDTVLDEARQYEGSQDAVVQAAAPRRKPLPQQHQRHSVMLPGVPELGPRALEQPQPMPQAAREIRQQRRRTLGDLSSTAAPTAAQHLAPDWSLDYDTMIAHPPPAAAAATNARDGGNVATSSAQARLRGDRARWHDRHDWAQRENQQNGGEDGAAAKSSSLRAALKAQVTMLLSRLRGRKPVKGKLAKRPTSIIPMEARGGEERRAMPSVFHLRMPDESRPGKTKCSSCHGPECPWWHPPAQESDQAQQQQRMLHVHEGEVQDGGEVDQLEQEAYELDGKEDEQAKDLSHNAAAAAAAAAADVAVLMHPELSSSSPPSLTTAATATTVATTTRTAPTIATGHNSAAATNVTINTSAADDNDTTTMMQPSSGGGTKPSKRFSLGGRRRWSNIFHSSTAQNVS